MTNTLKHVQTLLFSLKEYPAFITINNKGKEKSAVITLTITTPCLILSLQL